VTKYSDFFDPPTKKSKSKNKKSEGEFFENLDSDDEFKSPFQTSFARNKDSQEGEAVEEGNLEEGEEEGEENEQHDITTKEPEPTKLSRFALKKQRMEEFVRKLEDNATKAKVLNNIYNISLPLKYLQEWTLTGEVGAKKRPMNSLLENNLEFDQANKVHTS
jgi:U3 small nucleolar RNA-associated protein MPP10